MLIVGGHSGAGKSTLLKLIAAIERPTGGAVLVNGQNVGSLARGAIPYLRRNIGLIFQDQKLLFDRSIFDNVMLPLAIAGFAAERGGAARPRGTRQGRPALPRKGHAHRPFGRRAAAPGHRPRGGRPAQPVAGRRADGTPRRRHRADVAAIFREFHQVGVTVIIATYDERLFPDARKIRLDHGKVLAAGDGART